MMMVDDRLLDKFGDFYSSGYVAKNQPWIRQVSFAEWVERQLRSRPDDRELKTDEWVYGAEADSVADAPDAVQAGGGILSSP